MQTQGFSGKSEIGRRGHLTLITFVVGAALGVTFGWSASRSVVSSVGLDQAAGTTGETQAVVAPRAARADAKAGRKSLVVAMPEDRAYVKSSSIAVAGMAFGRPHGPRIRSVHVELYVGGQLLESADLEVFSARFAGILRLSRPIGRAEAELRFSDSSRRAGPVTRHLVIDTPASLLGPIG